MKPSRFTPASLAILTNAVHPGTPSLAPKHLGQMFEARGQSKTRVFSSRVNREATPDRTVGLDAHERDDRSVSCSIVLARIPGSLAGALGLIVGINMVFGGASTIGMALTARSEMRSAIRLPSPPPFTGLRLDRSGRQQGRRGASLLQRPPTSPWLRRHGRPRRENYRGECLRTAKARARLPRPPAPISCP